MFSFVSTLCCAPQALTWTHFKPPQAAPGPTEPRQQPEAVQTAQPVASGHQISVDSHRSDRESSRQDCTLFGGEQQVREQSINHTWSCHGDYIFS